MLEERVKKIKSLVATTSLLCVLAVFLASKIFPSSLKTHSDILNFSLLLGLLFTIILFFIPTPLYGTRKLFYSTVLASVFLISCVVYSGGGMRSQFFGLYLVVLIFSAVYQQIKGAFYATILVIISYSIIFYLNPGNFDQEGNIDILSYHLRFFTIVAFFSGYMIKKEIEYRNKVKDLLLKTIKVSSKVLDTKEVHLKGHAEEVAILSLEVADILKLSPSQKRDLQIAALFHDIGVSEIDEDIFSKPGKLSVEEFQQFKNHHISAEKLLSNTEELKNVLLAIRCSHERYDGEGYPEGLKGEEIPILSRIISVCDAFSSMTKEKPYREQLSKDEAIEEIKRNYGTQFDPTVVEAFLKVVSTDTDTVCGH